MLFCFRMGHLLNTCETSCNSQDMHNSSKLHNLIKPSRDNFFVLDIDSTLVTTHQRNEAILKDWTTQFKDQFPQDCLTLQQGYCTFGDFGLKQALERVKFTEQNPGSAEHLQNFWREHFFSNGYLHADVATRGAVDWTQNLEELGVEFVYLTARHKEAMWDGTLSSLDKLGFPINEDILFLKETAHENDEIYKTQLMGQILEKWGGKNVWLIDNEPVVLHQIEKDHPNVNLVWFESTHSGKKKPPEKALRINDFHFSSDD